VGGWHEREIKELAHSLQLARVEFQASLWADKSRVLVGTPLRTAEPFRNFGVAVAERWRIASGRC